MAVATEAKPVRRGGTRPSAAQSCARRWSATPSSQSRWVSSSCSSSSRSATRSTSASSTGGFSGRSSTSASRTTATSSTTRRSGRGRLRIHAGSDNSGLLEHRLLHRRRRPGADGARARARARRQRQDPRPDVLPRLVLLPIADLVGGDHRGRDLHPQPERRAERDPQQDHGRGRHERLVQRVVDGARVDHGPQHLDDLGDDDVSSTSRRSSRSRPTSTRRQPSTERAAGRIFWKITFPLLKPGHFFVAVLSVVGCLKIFDQAFIVSAGKGEGRRTRRRPPSSTSTRPRSSTSTGVTPRRSGWCCS